MSEHYPHHLKPQIKHLAEAARQAEPAMDKLLQRHMSALPAMAKAPKAKAEPQITGYYNGVPIDSSAKLFKPEPQSIEAYARKRAAAGCHKAKAELNRSN